MKFTLLILLSVVGMASGADLSKPLATPGKLLFADDFERAELGKDWKQVIGTFSARDGVMVGSQTRADHGAVGRVSVPMKDAVVEFRFQLAGSTSVNCVFDDRTYKGSHAGHICRVALTPRQIRLGDDKEGVMRNDIFEMRRDPQRKKAADKLLVGRGTAIKASLKQNQWYQVRIEIVDDEMRVSLDGKPIGRLQSSGLAHPTKSSFHFTVNGKDALFDDVKIWNAAPVSSN